VPNRVQIQEWFRIGRHGWPRAGAGADGEDGGGSTPGSDTDLDAILAAGAATVAPSSPDARLSRGGMQNARGLAWRPHPRCERRDAWLEGGKTTLSPNSSRAKSAVRRARPRTGVTVIYLSSRCLRAVRACVVRRGTSGFVAKLNKRAQVQCVRQSVRGANSRVVPVRDRSRGRPCDPGHRVCVLSPNTDVQSINPSSYRMPTCVSSACIENSSNNLFYPVGASGFPLPVATIVLKSANRCA